MGDVYAIHFWCNHAFDLVELGVLYWMVLRARRIQLLIVNTRLEVQRTIAAHTAEIRRLLTRDRVPCPAGWGELPPAPGSQPGGRRTRKRRWALRSGLWHLGCPGYWGRNCPLECRRMKSLPRSRGSSSQETLCWREMDSNHRYPRRILLAAPSIPQFTFRNINRLPRDRNRCFESTSLQQRVGCELDDTITAWRIVERGGPRAGRRCPAASARSRGRAFVEDVFEC